MKNIKIFTSCYNNCKSGNLVSISGDKGKSVGFNGNSYTKLAPRKSFWSIWHDNIGKIDEDKNNKYYMHEYYEKVLSKLDASEVVNELQQFGDKIVLLCFEKENEFCHRHLVATWLERSLKIQIEEISITGEGIFKFLERNQKYVEQFNSILDVYLDKGKE